MSTNTPGQPNFRSLFAGQLELLEGEMELDKAALYLAGEEYPELDVDYFLQQLDSLAEEIRRRVPNPDEDRAVIEAINRYLFDEQGFTGNQDNYYNPENSFLNRLLEDRRGIPITLSILYL